MRLSPTRLARAVLGLAIGLALALPPRTARAQEVEAMAFLTLPLVLKSGGWARYLTNSSDGPTQFVVRVGAPARHEGRSANWIDLETEVPKVGRVSVSLLVAGTTFEASSIKKMRLKLPGMEHPQDADEEPEVPAPAPRPKLLRTTKLSFAGKVLTTSEFALTGDVVAGWSKAVPGIGLTHVRGPEPVLLVAFGVGGDAWQDSGKTAAWPAGSPAQQPQP